MNAVEQIDSVFCQSYLNMFGDIFVFNYLFRVFFLREFQTQTDRQRYFFVVVTKKASISIIKDCVIQMIERRNMR